MAMHRKFQLRSGFASKGGSGSTVPTLSIEVTERYIHGKGERLHEVAKLIRLFPEQKGCNNEERVSG
jgi:hypothetical protein